MPRSVFDFENEDRVESPERLNEYIRVAKPGTWVMVSGLLLVLVAFIAWGFIGTIPKSVTLKGVVDESTNYSLDVVVDASQFSGKSLVGKEATYRLPSGATGKAKVTKATETPMSREEMTNVLESDFLASSLVDSDYSYVLLVQPEENLSDHGLEIGQVTVITDEVQPVSFLLR